MNRRAIDKKATLDKYESRISKIHPNEFRDLEGKFLSTFECYSNICQDVANDHHLCNHAVVLMRIAKKNNVKVLGVTSERNNKGSYCIDLPKPYARGETPIEYVGKYNYFTRNVSSKWRLAIGPRCSLKIKHLDKMVTQALYKWVSKSGQICIASLVL